LPIDDHRDEILQHINDHRVTIIHGETGCGKSSRVPLMLLEELGSGRHGARMFVSQPRRIAAKALMDRVRQASCEDLIGMRLGHGMRTEGPQTRVWFVTAGYLVRLLAHHPEAFSEHTHLIIDEVHERSVDTDILCLLAKRLL
ncbi:P-loop containing nucleoside triphosphate hydrolase protein, partial [Tribonema minus]